MSGFRMGVLLVGMLMVNVGGEWIHRGLGLFVVGLFLIVLVVVAGPESDD